MKKLMFFAATAAVALTSCSKQEVVDSANNVPNNPNTIAFVSNTSRANVNTLTNVEGGFQVFGHTDGATAWYNVGVTGEAAIDGTFDYYKPTIVNENVSDNNDWQWRNVAGDASVEAPMWPTAGYPMTFYAAYPKPDGVNGNTAISATVATPEVTGEKTIVADRFTQIDHLAAKSVASVKPLTGKLAMVFKHILTRENVSVTAGVGVKVEVQGIYFHGINSVNTYNYVAQSWGTAATKETYEYRKTVFAGSTTATNDAYMSGGDDAFHVDALGATEAIPKDAIHSNGSNLGDLMLLPHSFDAITLNTKGATSNVASIEGGAYIEVFYRVETNGSPAGTVDVVGRADIMNPTGSDTYYYNSDLSTYYTAANAIKSTANSGLLTAEGVYNGTDADNYVTGGTIATGDALYIRAYFPLYSDVDGAGSGANVGIQNWEMGNSYRYNLLIGGDGNGGYYADNKYYDEAGNETGLYHSGEPGDPVFDNRIHFTVTVTPWGTENEQNLGALVP